MKKAELLLAKKTILAHQVKMESQQIKEEMKHRRPTTTSGSLSSSGLSSLKSSHAFSPNHGHGHDLLPPRRAQSPQSVTSSQPSTQYRPMSTNTASAVLQRSASTPTSHGGPASHLTAAQLAEELAQRSVTDKTNLRKTQVVVSKSVEEELLLKHRRPPSSSSSTSSAAPPGSSSQQYRRPSTSLSSYGHPHGPSSSSAGTASAAMQGLAPITEEEIQQQLDSDENFFMPKKKLVRADGASLYDVYLSKKGDTWGNILKAQIREDEENKIKKKHDRDRANEEYGRLLRQQVQEHEERMRQERNANEKFAALENASAKRTEDMQKQRTENAINRHKQFVANAMEDVALKERLRQEDLKQDLRASTIMMNNAKRLISEEEEKRARDRAAMKAYQDRIYQENIDNIRRRQENKLNSHEEDRRIIAEQERIFQLQQQRRERELADRVKRSTEGPAHHIVQKIVELKQHQEENLYTTLFHADNSLNRQLQNSEEAARERAHANGANLELEWQRNTELKRLKKQQDEEKNRKIQATMVAHLQAQEQAELQRREAQRAAQRAYQQALDKQLDELRQRSFDSLKKTMSEAEMKFNADLIRKTGLLPSNL